ncbi:threonine/serine ThrE exporter family protein [Bifidobacterium gallicum]|nr:threonine/serine exporter family protein [Bifidobacterium gallicum]EFA22376.1 hypothetical protein BIFGAL_04137 [Bifidobacterium gallicum DSM 20093 = LMG 11596]
MEDIERDWDTPLMDAGIAAKASVIVRVGMLDLSAGTGSFRVREMMHRIAYPLGVHVRSDVSLTDLEATCTDGSSRITEVVNLPSTGVNTERIWLLEHYADWLSVNLGSGAMYHSRTEVSDGLMAHLDRANASRFSAQLSKQLREEQREEERAEKLEERRAAAGWTVHVEKNAGAASGSTTESNESVVSHETAVPASDSRETSQLSGEATAATEESGQGTQVGNYVLDALERANESFDTERGHAKQLREREGVEDRQARQARVRNGSHVPGAHSGRRGSQPITVRQAHARLDMIERRKPLYSPLFSGFAAACACASFVFLLGGNFYDMIGAFVGAGLGQWLRRKLFARHLNQFFVTFVVVAVAAFACEGVLRCIGIFMPAALASDTAYIGAMLFVIPGFPLITGGLDMAKIDFPSGVQRVAYVLCIILMATLAGWMVASAVQLSPGGFSRMEMPAVVVCALRALFSFIGVWGFSVLFNSPQRMCVVAAMIGMVANTARLECVDAGMAPEVGAFLFAMLAGLLATVWRASVRRGWLAPHLGYPRICLTVPSIVIMVPGLYMYRAMYELGQFHTMLALDWGFRAFMVILCLPIGLAMARVLTDKSWRYDD